MAKALQKYNYATGKEEEGLLENPDIPDGEITADKLADGVLSDKYVEVSSADTTPGGLNDKISVLGLIKSIVFPGAAEQLKLENEQKVKMNSGATANYLWNLLASSRLIKLTQEANDILISLDNINGLTGISPGDEAVLLIERTSDGALFKVSQDTMRSYLQRSWLAPVALDLDSTLAATEDTAGSITMVSLGSGNADYMKNKRCIWGYDDGKARFLRMLTGIGRDGWSYTDADLIKLRGERVIVSAADYSGAALHEQCWFSIKTEQVPGIGYFSISDIYGSEKQIDHVINAVFEFQYPISGGTPGTDGRWVLINYECMTQKFWKDSDTLITPDGVNFDIFFPNTNKFPMNGYYEFIAHIEIGAQWQWSEITFPVDSEYWDAIVVQLNDADGVQGLETTTSHLNAIGQKTGCPTPCCCTLEGNHNHNWINVMGFAHIDSVDCTTRYIRLRVIKPIAYPPTIWGISAVTWEVHYLGRNKAAYCNPAATP